jgi:hypothetical protein
MSKSKRQKREYQIADAAAQRRFKKHARKLQLYVLEKVGVNATTIDDAIELLEEANVLLPDFGIAMSQSSSPETGVFLVLCR